MKLRLFSMLAIFASLIFSSCGSDEQLIFSVSNDITTNTVLSGNEIHTFEGYVFVKNGATLTIEPGAILKFAEGQETAASALVVTRGSKIMAHGTAESPIIFTSDKDNIEVGQKTGTNLDENDQSLWGGLIILGSAPVSVKTTDTEGNIEGIVAEGGYGAYGGDNTTDNSGMLNYISVRHGGVSIGDDNEINGITLGGVGSGTVIENIEVVGTLDDGIECFGGTVNIKNALVAYQGDDAIDIDQNYSGTIENFVIIQGAAGDEALEIDGPEGSTHTTGMFTLKKGTIINDGAAGSVADLKSKAQGNIFDMNIDAMNNNFKISESVDSVGCEAKTDAYDRFLEGKLNIANNDVISAEISEADIVNVYLKDDFSGNCSLDADQEGLDKTITSENNSIVTAPTNEKGADTSVFGWTWAANNNKLSQ